MPETCGHTITDRHGDEQPCERPAPSWRWYQDVEHEDMLAPACIVHENLGGMLMADAQDRLTRAHQIALDLADTLESHDLDLHTSACQGEPGCPLCELLAVLSGTEGASLEAANHTPGIHPQPCATEARLAADSLAAPDPTRTPDATPEARRSEIMAALVRGFEAGYDIGAQTDETPRHLQQLRSALNAGDPDVAEAFWASKAWSDDERKAVVRAAKAWVRFAEVVGR